MSNAYTVVKHLVDIGITETADLIKRSGFSSRTVRRIKDRLRIEGYNLPRGEFPTHMKGKIIEGEYVPPTPHELMREHIEKSASARAKNKQTFFEIVGQDIISALDAIPAPQSPAITPPNMRAQHDPEEMVLLWSDSQVGQVVDQRESGGLGSYNTDIFRQRLEYLQLSLKKIFEIHVSNTHYPTFNIFFLGDIIEGTTIFPGQQRQTDLHSVAQVMEAVDKIAEFVAWIAGQFPWAVRCYCVVGNHGRIGKKGEESPLNNLDYLVYWIIKERLRNYSNVRFEISESWYMIVQKLGWRFLLIHGDDTRGWMGVPYYGMERSESRMGRMVGDAGSNFQYYCCGHHHQEATIKSRMFLNGSWVGGSEFSIKKMQTANKPTQMLFSVHKDFGVTWERNMQLENPANKLPVKIFE